MNIYFKNDTKPRTNLNFENLIHQIKSGEKFLGIDIAVTQNYLRSCSSAKKVEQDKIKCTLPGIVFSCIYKVNRKIKLADNHTGLIVIDYDNLSPDDIATAFKKATEWNCVKLVFRSPSGTGLKVIINTDCKLPSDHEAVWKSLVCEAKNKIGNFVSTIPSKPKVIDESGIDISRLCFIAHDPNLYFNEAAIQLEVETLKLDYLEFFIAGVSKSDVPLIDNPDAVPLTIADQIVRTCELKKIDLTGTYDAWIRIGASLKTIPNGNQLFHRISKLNSTYNHDDCEKKWNEIGESKNTTLGSLVYFAIKAGAPVDFGRRTFSPIEFAESWFQEQWEFRRNTITDLVEFKNREVEKWIPIEDENFDEWYIELRKIEIIGLSNDKVKRKRFFITKDDLKSVVLSKKFSPSVNPLIELFKKLSFEATDKSLSEVDKFISIMTFASGTEKQSHDFWKFWFYGVKKNLVGPNYFEHLLVLKGGQGIGKTSMILELCAVFSKYFLQHFDWSLTKADDYLKLARSLVIFDDEMRGITRAEIEAIKRVTSLTEINGLRKAYGHFEKDYKRIASFIAATNSDQFLTDLTGNRRYLVLEIEKIDWEALNKIDFKLLWGQVWHHYFELSEVEKIPTELINGSTERHRSKSLLEEIIERHFFFPNDDANDLVEMMKERGFKITSEDIVWINNACQQETTYMNDLEIFDFLKLTNPTLVCNDIEKRKLNSIIKSKGVSTIRKRRNGTHIYRYPLVSIEKVYEDFSDMKKINSLVQSGNNDPLFTL